MQSLVSRSWETQATGLWSNGALAQHLSIVRWHGEEGSPPQGSYILSVTQASPQDSAVLSAIWEERFSAHGKPVAVSEAIDPAGLESFLNQFRQLPGTPENVSILEQVI